MSVVSLVMEFQRIQSASSLKRIFLKMLQYKLPPCVGTEEHIVAFCRYVAQKKKAFLERKFRDEMVDQMLDMCEPLHELFKN